MIKPKMIRKTVQANALHLPIASDIVQCVVTSPPYYGLRDYGTAGLFDNSFGQSGSGVCENDSSTRNKRSVWTIPTRPFAGAHFATFPPALALPMILSSSRRGDLVLDPFSGAGTVKMVSAKHGRQFIGTELSHEYIKIDEKRNAVFQPVLF